MRFLGSHFVDFPKSRDAHAFFANLDFYMGGNRCQKMLYSQKPQKQNDSDIGLSKKSKIIEIGSVTKKLQLPEVSGFSKNPYGYWIFVR